MNFLCALSRPSKGPCDENGRDVDGLVRQLFSAGRPFEIAFESRHRG